jgi:hypothetical protein
MRTRFQRGNPGGARSRPNALTKALRAELERIDGDLTEAEWIAKALVRAARGGNVKAIALIFDRTEGKAAEATPAEGNEALESMRLQLKAIFDHHGSSGA